jgi:4a-hydroxytetrahydrobiopterin dehydratase
MDFTKKRCVPCEGGTPRMSATDAENALRAIPGWEVQENGTRIHKTYRFKDFVEAMKFVNALADLAEAEGHHPDFNVHYSVVDVTLWTHVAGGLTENDFIVASKLDIMREANPHG